MDKCVKTNWFFSELSFRKCFIYTLWTNIPVAFKFEQERLAVLQMAPLGRHRKTPNLEKWTNNFQSSKQCCLLYHSCTHMYQEMKDNSVMYILTSLSVTSFLILSIGGFPSIYPAVGLRIGFDLVPLSSTQQLHRKSEILSYVCRSCCLKVDLCERVLVNYKHCCFLNTFRSAISYIVKWLKGNVTFSTGTYPAY